MFFKNKKKKGKLKEKDVLLDNPRFLIYIGFIAKVLVSVIHLKLILEISLR